MGRILTDEQFLQNLIDKDVKDMPVNTYKGSNTKILWRCHNNPEHIYNATPNDLYRSKQCCPYCNRRRVFVGETDMWTTNPELAKMLLNKDEGYEFFATSSKRVDWVCPCCGAIVRDKIINNVRMYGLSCPSCFDGMSFAEKFLNSFLRQFCVDLIYDKTTRWSCNKRYDFYSPSMSLIVEVHGLQHYEDCFGRFHHNHNHRALVEEIRNDSIKRDMAKSNGIQHYIELDCRKSDCDYIKGSILNSELSNLFNLSDVDWDMCFSATVTSNVITCAELWNSGVKNTLDIANCTKLHITSVISYLKRAAELNLCDYVPNYKKNKNMYKPVLCIETQKTYECISRVKDDGYCNTHVSDCCNGKIETAHGKHWRFL